MDSIKQAAIDAVALTLCAQDFSKWECQEDKGLFSDYQLIAQRSLKSVNCDVDTKKCIAQYALSLTFKRELTTADIAQGILALLGIGMTGCLPDGHPPKELTDVPFDMTSSPDANTAGETVIEDIPYNVRLEDGQKIPIEDTNTVDTVDTVKTETLALDSVTSDLQSEAGDYETADETSLVDTNLNDTQVQFDTSPDSLELAEDQYVPDTTTEVTPPLVCDADGDGIITGDIKDPALLDAIKTGQGKGPDDDITLEDAQKLTKLVANGKGISDLSGIECFTNLVEAQFSNNQISDVTPLAGAKTLKHLWLDGNLISNGDPLANLINIEWFFISNNPISDISFAASFENLVWFVAMFCNIMDITPLSNLKKIETLILDGNLIIEVPPFASAMSLNSFTIHNNFVSDIYAVSGMTFLKVFGAGNNYIADINALSGLLFLNIASLYTNQIEDIMALVENNGLGTGDTVELSGNPKIPSEQIEALKAKGVTVSW